MSDEQIPVTIHTPTGDVDASTVELPLTERRFRNAWRLEGEVINIDMAAAREIARTEIRTERAERFKQLDVEYMRATELGAAVEDIVQRKHTLRAAPNDPRIDEAEDDVALAEVVDDILTRVRAV